MDVSKVSLKVSVFKKLVRLLCITGLLLMGVDECTADTSCISLDGIRLQMTFVEVESILGKPKIQKSNDKDGIAFWKYSNISILRFRRKKQWIVSEVLGLNLCIGKRPVARRGDDLKTVEKNCYSVGPLQHSAIVDPAGEYQYYYIEEPGLKLFFSFRGGELWSISMQDT